MKSETVTYVKAHVNSLEINEPLAVTQNGKTKFVIQNADQYFEQQETLALLKLLLLSEKSAESGTMTLDEAFDID